jgi:hypothetical protein
MRKIIGITALTLKRLQNYQKVVDRELKNANKLQWTEMALDQRQEYEAACKKADRIDAAVGYAGFLFRVQNGLAPARIFYSEREQVLRNDLVDLLNELLIPVVMMKIAEEMPDTANSG